MGRPARITPGSVGAERTLQLITELGVTHHDFALMVGLDPSTLAKYLRGRIKITLRAACDIEDMGQASGVPVPVRDWLRCSAQETTWLDAPLPAQATS